MICSAIGPALEAANYNGDRTVIYTPLDLPKSGYLGPKAVDLPTLRSVAKDYILPLARAQRCSPLTNSDRTPPGELSISYRRKSPLFFGAAWHCAFLGSGFPDF